MKIKILKFIALLFVFAGGFSFCNKNTLDDSNIDMSNIDFSNIEDLHAQPLPVIQKCVEGKWQWININRQWSVPYKFTELNNSFVDINENNIIITQQEDEYVWADLSGTYSYYWKKMKTHAGYTTYVICNNMVDSGQIYLGLWYFSKIQNDTLYVNNDQYGFEGVPYPELYLFVKSH